MNEHTASRPVEGLAPLEIVAAECLHDTIGRAIDRLHPVTVNTHLSSRRSDIAGLPTSEDLPSTPEGSWALFEKETDVLESAWASISTLLAAKDTLAPAPPTPDSAHKAVSSLWRSATFTNTNGHPTTLVRTALFSAYGQEYASQTEVTVREPEITSSTHITVVGDSVIDADAFTVPTELYEDAQEMLGAGPELKALTSLMNGVVPGPDDVPTLLYTIYHRYQDGEHAMDIGMLLEQVQEQYKAALETRELEQMFGGTGNPGLSLDSLVDLNAQIAQS